LVLMKRTALALTFILALLVSTMALFDTVHFGTAQSGTSEDWPMFGHDPSHSGNALSVAPDTNTGLWLYQLGGQVNYNSPAVVNDSVFIASESNPIGGSNGIVYSLNATNGSLIWEYQTGFEVSSSPAVVDGKVFIAAGSNIYALNEVTGGLIWCYQTLGGVINSPAVSEGMVFIGGTDESNGCVYCLNATTGNLMWNYLIEPYSVLYTSPAVADGKVFIGSENGNVYALNDTTGSLIWSYKTSSFIYSSPTVGENEVFIASHDNGAVYALNETTGALMWNYTLGGGAQSSPAFADGRIFIGLLDKKIYSFNATTGSLMWSYDTNSTILSSPAAADGKVFIGSEIDSVGDNFNGLYALNETSGALIWKQNTPNGVRSSPVVADGNLYVSSGSYVYAFGTGAVSVAIFENPTLTLDLSSAVNYLGFQVTISGVLGYKDVGITGASILLSYSVTGGQTWNEITSVNTSSDGSYSAVWIPSATGTYLVKASWAGNDTFQSTELSRALSVTSFNDQYVFSVTSNSTISALAFNSTSNELSFTVSGPFGTTGFVDMQVAKSLVGNIANLKVYLDGNNLDYTATATSDSWLLYFTYTHSTHTITVDLSSAPTPSPTPAPSSSPTPIIPEFPTWTTPLLFALAILLSTVFIRKRIPQK